MDLLRRHWFDIGIVLALVTGLYLVIAKPASALEFVLWLNLIALFLHQFEEYHYPGYFPGMVNNVMFASKMPDRYPLNMNTAFLVNVVEGWILYALAAIVGERALWLGIAAVLVSFGNVVAHTILFNVKGKTIYNPGMLTSVVLFLPIVVYFFVLVLSNQLATLPDWIVGVTLGVLLNYLGVLKLIELLGDKNTLYVFPPRCLPPNLRQKDS